MQGVVAKTKNCGAIAKESIATRQRQLIDAITGMKQARGYLPSQRELAAELGLSLTRIAQLVQRCEADGLITRKARSARTLSVVSNSK